MAERFERQDLCGFMAAVVCGDAEWTQENYWVSAGTEDGRQAS